MADRSLHTLKVDGTALPVVGEDRNGEIDGYLVVFNVNIPERMVYDVAEFRRVLERTRDFLLTEFQGNVVYYQVTAAYLLRNTRTGETKLWTGSFFPRGNQVAHLSPFQTFDPATFVANVERDASADSIEARLTWTDHETSWIFDSLISIIVNSQSGVSVVHPVLTRRRLITGNGANRRRANRVHVTFALS